MLFFSIVFNCCFASVFIVFSVYV